MIDPLRPSARPGTRPLRTYVLDTSVLLSDPRALTRFDEHEVVLQSGTAQSGIGQGGFSGTGSWNQGRPGGGF